MNTIIIHIAQLNLKIQINTILIFSLHTNFKKSFKKLFRNYSLRKSIENSAKLHFQNFTIIRISCLNQK